MPLYTSLLLFFIALALLPLAIRNSNVRNTRRERVRDVERMTIGAKICEAAARDAFDIELDHSIESIVQLDAMITNGWGNDAIGTDETNQIKIFESESYDLNFIFASYLGDTFVRHEHAVWQWEKGEACIYFKKEKHISYPFILIAHKLQNPKQIHLQDEIANWITSNDTSIHA
jgi:hypothetical protein